MKVLFTILISMVWICAGAQTHLPVETWGYGATPWFGATQWNGGARWQVKPFASVSAGYVFYNGGFSYVSAPVGVAVFRPVSPNWTAFGAATVSPTVFSVNHLSTMPITDPNYHGYPFGTGYGLGLSTGIQGGMIYTNDAKTFSISGSVRIDRSSYPIYPVYQYNRVNTK